MSFLKLFSALACLALAAPAAYCASEKCLGAICVGKSVIDANNRVGLVDSTDADKNVVKYIISGYIYSANAASLAPEVKDVGAMSAETVVVDKENRVGTVVHAFADGRIQYNISGYLYVSKELSPETPKYGRAAKDSKMIDAENHVGTIVHVFSDGRAQYDVGGYLYVSSKIAIGIGELGGIRAGAVVVDPNNHVGAATVVFEDGRVQYKINGYLYISNRLEPEITVFGGLARGRLVIDAENHVGAIAHVFRDGRVQYNVNGYYYVSARVSPEAAPDPSDDALKPDVTIIDSSNRVGIVSSIFDDNRVQYLVDGYAFVGAAATLSPETESHVKYRKDRIYATASYAIGKPSRFFRDGRIAHLSLDGYVYIVRELFRQVPEKDGYATGTEIVDPSGLLGTIELVFENGSLLVGYTSEGRDNKPIKLRRPSKIHGVNADKLDEDNRAWISLLAQSLRWKLDDIGMVAPYGTLAIRADSAEALKTRLRDLLKAAPELVNDEALRTKVLSALGEKEQHPPSPIAMPPSNTPLPTAERKPPQHPELPQPPKGRRGN